MVFKNIKDILENIYSDMKKGTRYIIQLSFRIPDDEVSAIRDTSDSKPSIPVTQDLLKARKVLRKINIKKKPRYTNNNYKIKKKNSDSNLNIRKF